jgi:hypothetical protein
MVIVSWYSSHEWIVFHGACPITTIVTSPYAILHRGPYSISLWRLIFPVDKIQRQKLIFFHIYTSCTLYIMSIRRLLHYNPHKSGFVPENEIKCLVSMSRKEIFDPWPFIYYKCYNSSLQFHFEGCKEANSKLWKKGKEFNFESKVTLEELFTSY